MTETLGHFGMALIFLAPAWYFIDNWRTAVVFVATGFWFGPVPDVDTYLSNWFPNLIHHHGVVHTLPAVVLMTAILGPILGWVLKRVFGSTKWFSREATNRATQMGVIAVGAATLSHLFADILSAPDISTHIEPLWPLVKGPVVYVDVLYYNSIWATWGLFVLGLAANAAFFYLTTRRPSNQHTQPS
jgi:inner membrane protein